MRKHVLAYCLALASAASAFAAPIEFDLVEFTDYPFASNSVIIVSPLAPTKIGTRISTGPAKRILAPFGYVKTNLNAGRYSMTMEDVPWQAPIYFHAPPGTNAYSFAKLIVSGGDYYSYVDGIKALSSGDSSLEISEVDGVSDMRVVAVHGGAIATTSTNAAKTLLAASNTVYQAQFAASSNAARTYATETTNTLKGWTQAQLAAIPVVTNAVTSNTVFAIASNLNLTRQPASTNLTDWAQFQTNVLGEAGISATGATNAALGVLSQSSVAYLSQLVEGLNTVSTSAQASLNSVSNALVAQIVAGSATNAVGNNGGFGTNLNLTGTTTFTGSGAGVIGFYNASGSTLVAGWNGSFWYGVAAGLTGLNASSLAVGLVPLARLSGITYAQMDPETDAIYREQGSGGGLGGATNTANIWYQPQTFLGGINTTGAITVGTIYFGTLSGTNIAGNGQGLTNVARSGVSGLESALAQFTNSITALAGGPTNGVSAGTSTNIAQTVVAQAGLATTNMLNGTNSVLAQKQLDGTNGLNTALVAKINATSNAVVQSETWLRQAGRPNLSNWAGIATSSKLSVGQSIPVPTGDWVAVFTDPFGSANLLEYSDIDGRWVIPGTTGLRVLGNTMTYQLYVESTAALTGDCNVSGNLDVNGSSRLTGVVLLDDGPGGASGIQAAGTNILTLFGPMKFEGTTYADSMYFAGGAEMHQSSSDTMKLQDAGWDVDGSITAAKGYFLPSSTPETWPTVPRTDGEAYFGSSNGVVYLLESEPGSGMWTQTNPVSASTGTVSGGIIPTNTPTPGQLPVATSAGTAAYKDVSEVLTGTRGTNLVIINTASSHYLTNDANGFAIDRAPQPGAALAVIGKVSASYFTQVIDSSTSTFYRLKVNGSQTYTSGPPLFWISPPYSNAIAAFQVDQTNGTPALTIQSTNGAATFGTAAASPGWITLTNLPPTAAPAPGATFIWNSNGVNSYILKSSYGGTSWTGTNVLF